MTRTPPEAAGRLADFQKNAAAATTPMEVLNQTEEAVSLITESAKHVDANLNIKLITLAQALRRESNRLRGLKPTPDLIIDIEEGIPPGQSADPATGHATGAAVSNAKVTVNAISAARPSISAPPGAATPRPANTFRGVVVNRNLLTEQMRGIQQTSVSDTPMPPPLRFDGGPSAKENAATPVPTDQRHVADQRHPVRPNTPTNPNQMKMNISGENASSELVQPSKPQVKSAPGEFLGQSSSALETNPTAPSQRSGPPNPVQLRGAAGSTVDDALGTAGWGRASFDLFESAFESLDSTRARTESHQYRHAPGTTTQVPAYLKPTVERSPNSREARYSRKLPPPGQQPPPASPAESSVLPGSVPSSTPGSAPGAAVAAQESGPGLPALYPVVPPTGDEVGRKDPGRGNRVRSHRARSQPRAGPYYGNYDPNSAPVAGQMAGEAYSSQMQYSPYQMGSYLSYPQSGGMPYHVGYPAGYAPGGGYSGQQFYGGWPGQYPQPYGQYVAPQPAGYAAPQQSPTVPFASGAFAAPSYDYYGAANHMMVRGFNPTPPSTSLQPPGTTFVGEPIIAPGGGYSSPHSSAVRLEENQFREQ